MLLSLYVSFACSIECDYTSNAKPFSSVYTYKASRPTNYCFVLSSINASLILHKKEDVKFHVLKNSTTGSTQFSTKSNFAGLNVQASNLSHIVLVAEMPDDSEIEFSVGVWPGTCERQIITTYPESEWLFSKISLSPVNILSLGRRNCLFYANPDEVKIKMKLDMQGDESITLTTKNNSPKTYKGNKSRKIELDDSDASIIQLPKISRWFSTGEISFKSDKDDVEVGFERVVSSKSFILTTDTWYQRSSSILFNIVFVLLVILIVIASYFCCCRKKKSDSEVLVNEDPNGYLVNSVEYPSINPVVTSQSPIKAYY